MEKEIKEMYIAEMERGKTYALPAEWVSDDLAKEITELIEVNIVRLPMKCFEVSLDKVEVGNKFENINLLRENDA